MGVVSLSASPALVSQAHVPTCSFVSYDFLEANRVLGLTLQALHQPSYCPALLYFSLLMENVKHIRNHTQPHDALLYPKWLSSLTGDLASSKPPAVFPISAILERAPAFITLIHQYFSMHFKNNCSPSFEIAINLFSPPKKSARQPFLHALRHSQLYFLYVAHLAH